MVLRRNMIIKNVRVKGILGISLSASLCNSIQQQKARLMARVPGGSTPNVMFNPPPFFIKISEKGAQFHPKPRT